MNEIAFAVRYGPLSFVEVLDLTADEFGEYIAHLRRVVKL